MKKETNVSGDLALSYDNYYNGGDNSVYNQRFKRKKLTIKERRAIENKITEFQDREEICILDFGCGDGRYFEAIYSFISNKEKQQPKIRLIGYDISSIGLKYYKQTLLDLDFQEGSSSDSVPPNSVISNKLKKGNIVVELIQGSGNETGEWFHNIIGREIDIIMCMFGVLSHISSRNKRVDILRIFRQLMKAESHLLLSVPSTKDFKSELKLYNLLRMQQKMTDGKSVRIQNALALAQEEGDIYYCRPNGNGEIIENYYHIYRINELKDDFLAAGFKKLKLSAISFWHPSIASSSIIRDIQDCIYSFIISLGPDKLIETMCSYILVEYHNV